MLKVVMDSTSVTRASSPFDRKEDIKINVNTENVEVKGLTKEEDPTVPSWAKQPTKPEYNSEEVGALPKSTFIPKSIADLVEDAKHQTVTAEEKERWNKGTDDYKELKNKPTKVSDFTNDVGFITGYTEEDPTVPSWAKQPTKPTYTAGEVGALPDTTVIPNSLADLSDDATHRTVTDEQITKWNNGGGTLDYNDLINKPTKVSDFTNDVGFITGYTEEDPTVPSWAKQPTKPTYTAGEVGALPDTTKIPTAVSELTNDSGYLVEEDVGFVTEEDIDAMWRGDYNNG